VLHPCRLRVSKECGVAFDYDAAGHRMRRIPPTGQVTDCVYGRTGMLLGEYPGGVLYGKEYVYLGSQLIASPKTHPQAPAAHKRAPRSTRCLGTGITLHPNETASTTSEAPASRLWKAAESPPPTGRFYRSRSHYADPRRGHPRILRRRQSREGWKRPSVRS
jgi:hypothetical protein